MSHSVYVHVVQAVMLPDDKVLPSDLVVAIDEAGITVVNFISGKPRP